jgi:uncharacterized protein (DUF362 family)
MSKVKSTVALVRSSKNDAAQITDEEIRQMVREAVHLAGGLSDIVKDGQFVVIKPNLVTTRHVTGSIKPFMMVTSNPFKEKVQVPQLVNGITTDRRVTKAMVELVRELNPTGKVYIMECAGDGLTSENFKRMGYNHENIPGVDKFVAMGEDGEFRNVDAEGLVAVNVKNQQYKNLPKFLKNKYYFDKTYYSADVIISLCCVKNHMNAAVTGGIKNVGIGARPANIYGMAKDKTVSAFVIGHTWEPINNFIHDYYSAKPVDFVLSDGLQGLSYGPAAHGAPSYEEAKMNMRLILASKDAVACDTVQSCIVGVDPEKVNYLKDLAKDGFGTIDTSKIAVVGNARVDEVKKRFPLPDGMVGFTLCRGSKKTVYDDFDAPKMAIGNLSVNGNQLTAKMKIDKKVNKVEMYVDEILVHTFREGFNELKYSLNGANGKGAHKVTFHAYDRLLNCSVASSTFDMR